MIEIVPEAYFDGLAIAADAPVSSLPMSVQEMHLYSYLGCVLALFQGRAVADWGYEYVITSEGFPFSKELDEARKVLIANGALDMDGQGLLRPNLPALTDELDIVSTLSDWGDRRATVRAATECSLALPMGSIRYAISRSPGMATSFLLGQRGKLLERDDAGLLYQEYTLVSSVLGAEKVDILAPAVVWLSARILRKDSEHV